ncbi:MAG: hypothetical protein QXW87_03910 [Desulfurococcaceae archaeon]
MINPLYPFFIPILHKLLSKWIRRVELHYLFPSIYLLYTIYSALYVKYSVYGYSLSTIPVFAEIHTPIILIIDPHVTVFQFINALIYFIIVKQNPGENTRLIPLISVLTLNYYSLDLLLCVILLLIIIIYIVFIDNKIVFINYYLIIIMLFTIGFLFTNTYNIGLIVAYTKFRHIYGVAEQALIIGFFIYILLFLTILFISINFYPFVERDNLGNWNKIFLLIYSLSILFRLKPILETLYVDIYNLLKYSTLVLSTVNMLNHSILYLKTRESIYIDYYELSFIPLILFSGTYFAYIVLVLIIVTHLIHTSLSETNSLCSKDSILLSKIGLPPLIGGLPRILSTIIMVKFIGLLFTIIPLLTYMFILIVSLTQFRRSLLDESIIRKHFVLNILLITSILLIEPVGRILYRFPDVYYKVIFGV